LLKSALFSFYKNHASHGQLERNIYFSGLEAIPFHIISRRDVAVLLRERSNPGWQQQ